MYFLYALSRPGGAKFSKLDQIDHDSSELKLRQDDDISLRHRGPISYFALVSISILVSSLSFLIGMMCGKHFKTVDFTAITQYSPVLKDVPLSYGLTQFNGSFMKPNVFRGPAGPEVDAAWRSLGIDYSPVLLPPSMAGKSGIQLDQVKVSAKYGGGYLAGVEGLHHLHCLNLLRQALWYNFEYYNATGEGSFNNKPDMVELHITHCLDILRQQLMCTVDVGVMGQVWIHPDTPTPLVDFNTIHKCRNFDAVRRWVEERQVTPPDYDDWLELPKAGDRIYDEIP